MSAIRPGGDAFKAQEAASTPTPMAGANYKPGDTKIDKGFIEMMRKGHESPSSTTSLNENHKVKVADKSDSFITKIVNFIKSLFSSKTDAVAINNKMAESLNKADFKRKDEAFEKIKQKYNESPSPQELQEAGRNLPQAKRDLLFQQLENAKNQAVLNANGGKDSLQEDLNRIGIAKQNIRKEIANLQPAQGSLQSKKQEYLDKIDSLRDQMTKLKDNTSPKIKQQMGEDFADREKQFNAQLIEARNIVNSMTTTSNTQDADRAIRSLGQRIQEYEGEVRFQQSQG